MTDGQPSQLEGGATGQWGELAIRVLMMPRDTNGHGSIFGGVLLSYIDQAGAVVAQKETRRKIVTVAIHEVVFLSPVRVGDVVSFYGEVVRVGRTSITTTVRVSSMRVGEGGPQTVDVTQATVVYVAIDEEGRPQAVAS